MSEEKKTIEISEDLYQAIQQLKGVFWEITWQQVESDEEAIGILVGGFIDSINAEQNNGEESQGEEQSWDNSGENSGWSDIIT